MQKDRSCNNIRPVAKNIENEVENSFKQFAIKLENTAKVKSNIDIVSETMSKNKNKLKKLYSMYAENDSDSLHETILDLEKEIKILQIQLDAEKANETSVKNQQKSIESIKKIADVWDSLSSKEKNKILKQCVEKVVITGDDVSIHFNLD